MNMEVCVCCAVMEWWPSPDVMFIVAFSNRVAYITKIA